jgi:hypothetical protein
MTGRRRSATTRKLDAPDWHFEDETPHRLGMGISVAAVVLGLILVVALRYGLNGEGQAATDLTSGADAELRPDLMILEPSVVPAGGATTVRFARPRSRGVTYFLEIEDGRSWAPRYVLTAGVESYSDGLPRWSEVGSDTGWDDVAVTGGGPDDVLIPDIAAAGTYRLCTTGSLGSICALLTVTDP